MSRPLLPPQLIDAPAQGSPDDRSPGLADSAAAAWVSLPGKRRMPDSVAAVQIRPGTAVYRLGGASADGDVFAKLTPDASIERLVYEHVLPRLSINRAPYLGAARNGCGEWIFLEDVGGEPYNWAIASHREAAAHWLASLHVAARDRKLTRELPPRGLPYWHSILMRVRELTLPWAEAGRAASSIVAACDEVRARWGEVTRLATRLPETLVHGDLVPKNIRVLDGGASVCPIDWGSAGFGVAAIDVAYVDPQAYWRASHQAGQELTSEDSRGLSSLGRFLRNLLLVSWLCEEAAYSDIDQRLAVYARWIGAELRILRTVA
jgi:thiamine kinase-like enzyme